MQAGQLSTRVTLQARTTAADELGQPLDLWSDLATVWADVRHSGGLEVIRAGGQVSEVRASIRIRRRTDLTAGMRVVVGSVVYDIEAVLPHAGRQDHTDLVCKVVT